MEEDETHAGAAATAPPSRPDTAQKISRDNTITSPIPKSQTPQSPDASIAHPDEETPNEELTQSSLPDPGTPEDDQSRAEQSENAEALRGQQPDEEDHSQDDKSQQADSSVAEAPIAVKPESQEKEDMPPPPRPVPAAAAHVDSSFTDVSSSYMPDYSLGDAQPNDSMMQQQEVMDHLQDIESSFVPPISPTIQVNGPNAGIDDTFVFDASPSKQPIASAGIKTIPEETESQLLEQDQPRQSIEAEEPGNTTSSLEQFDSSPAAAAAARTVSRIVSGPNNPPALPHDRSFDDSQNDPQFDVSQENPFSAAPTNFRQVSGDAGSTPGYALKIGKRPRYLRSRNASQRSSTSSHLTNDDADSDATVNMSADYALQTGGAGPAFGLPRNTSNPLSRSVSMGSMLSGFDDSQDIGRPGPLEPLEEIEPPSPPPGPNDVMMTPKANKTGSLLAPTDTVIARHVRNVQVPESLANEYKTKGGLATPVQPYRKLSDYTPISNTHGRGGRGNMTLKEQSSTIERLSKENFDLKLKVMFLSDRLDKLSEEGIKEMISENVELKTSLAVVQRDNKILRRRVKELEKSRRDDDDRPSTAKSGYSSDGGNTPMFDEHAQEREEELIYLREQVEDYITEIEKLRNESMNSHVEKRKLAETIKTMGDRAGDRIGDNIGKQEEADVFKDLYEQESARREQADDENRRLRDEIFRLRQEGPGGASGSNTGLHHTTNIYNITRKARPISPSRSRPMSGLSGDMDQGNSMSQASTLVEELRRESEQLRHENAELRREVGAQTSMLTSRNREKERLYQEIEELKLAQRRAGGSGSTLDSLLDRSASRAGHDRPGSRASVGTRLTMTAEDPDREELENKLAEHRDKINELKFQNQDLQQQLTNNMGEYDALCAVKADAEDRLAEMEAEWDERNNEVQQFQQERDEALGECEAWEIEFNKLQGEAQEEIDTLEAELDQKTDEIQQYTEALEDRDENLTALQEEMRHMSEALVGLEDEQDNKLRRIGELENEINEANRELEDLESKLLESNEKCERLGVQQESSQAEIAFLREEQEGDKIRIGDLEAALANVEQSLRDERERAKELDQRLDSERDQREIVASREKEEVQHIINELNREASTAKDESRRLRKSLTSREVEAAEWKERLMELENNLREALGDLSGTRSSFLKSISNLQKELETTVRELDSTKASIVEKDRLIKQRDSLLESHGLESRKLADSLDKERQAHRNTKNQFETFQRTNSHVSRTVTSQDTRIQDLESSRSADRRRMAQLESSFKEQLVERNNLLLVLWGRLSAICGKDWTHNNSLISGRALPSLESVSTMLPGFSKNLLSAVKAIETMMTGFQNRIKGVERDLSKDYQSLESMFETRNKKLERLEAIVRSGVSSGDFSSQGKLNQLETAYRALKIENATLQRALDARTRGAVFYDENEPFQGSPAPAVPTGPGSKIPRSKTSHMESNTTTKSRMSTMVRSSSSGMSPNEIERLGTSSGSQGDGSGDDNRVMMLRLRDMEQKLKSERDARMLDRAAARQRIHDSERQNQELVAQLSRASRRGGSGGE